jgi:hypothetical protein
MKIKLVLFGILVWLVMGKGSVAQAQSNFTVTPKLAFQVSVPAQESYQYQVQFTTNLSSTNWLPATGLQVATTTNLTLTFGMTNGPQNYYRVQQYPPNLTNRIVGLTNIYFDNALFQGQGATMTVSGFRAISRDYNLSDYLEGQFQFDPLLQTFSLTNLQVFTNVGVVCGQSPPYYMKNATNRLFLTNGLTTLNPDTYNSITTTGQVMTVYLTVGQSLAFNLASVSYTNEVLVFDPNGTKLADYVIETGYTWWFGGYGGLVPGVYTLQIVPKGVTSDSMQLEFHNDNGTLLTVLTNGMNVAATSYGPESGDYLKYQVVLTAGQTLQLTGPDENGVLAIYNSLGVQVFTEGNGAPSRQPFFYTPTSTDTYYVVLSHVDVGISHSYSTTVSITP